MRIARFVAVGLMLTVMLCGASQAQQSQGNTFNSANCSQKFLCNADSSQLGTIAQSCVRRNMGYSMDFSDASTDGNNCLVIGGGGGQHGTTIKCCTQPDQSQADMCTMSCSLLIN